MQEVLAPLQIVVLDGDAEIVGVELTVTVAILDAEQPLMVLVTVTL